MPFSWKNKTRRNRFSQLVADHLQSPKRGGSLVVETGFPTSLIDLYVRNRGRFRKYSAKKQRGNDSPNQLSSCLFSPSSSSLVDLYNSSSSASLVDSKKSSSGDSEYRETDEIIEEDVVAVGDCMVASDGEIRIENYGKVQAEKSVEMAKLNPVLVVAIKVLFMVVLGLGSKRFTVGITLSSFLLFFLELVGKPLLGRSSSVKTSVDSKALFESSLQETNNIKQTTTLVVCSEVLEIEEQVQSKQEVRSEKESDEVRTEVLIEITRKLSRRAMMKSRIKKLVPKKLRRPSLDSKHEICCEFKEDEPVKSAQNVNPSVCSNECLDSKGETFGILKDKIVETGGRSLSSTLSSGTEGNDEESGTDLPQDSGCLVLFLIVLVGLIGGRVLAVVIALSWCLMLKLQLRNVIFPIS